jgi:uncharacterized protein YfaT (DUF1175 family)
MGKTTDRVKRAVSTPYDAVRDTIFVLRLIKYSTEIIGEGVKNSALGDILRFRRNDTYQTKRTGQD